MGGLAVVCNLFILIQHFSIAAVQANCVGGKANCSQFCVALQNAESMKLIRNSPHPM